MADLPDDAAFRRELAARRAAWSNRSRPPGITTPGPGQESVWDYPRPPEVRAAEAPLKVMFAGQKIASTSFGLKVVETAGAPVYFFSPTEVDMDVLKPRSETTFCEWKGEAVYFDLVTRGRKSDQAAFSYPDPLDDLQRGFGNLAGWIGFYAGRVDEAWVGNERATPQPGGFYAGWVTSRLTGPIKGEPGSEGW